MEQLNRPQGLNLNIKPEDLKDIVCEECGGRYFRQVNSFKRLSALLSPVGKPSVIPIQVFACHKCGHINKSFLPKENQDNDSI